MELTYGLEGLNQLRDLTALRTIVQNGVLILAAILVFLEVVSIATNLKKKKPLDPEDAAKHFFEALGTHQYTEACKFLSQELRQKTDEGDLKRQVQAIEDLHYGIREVMPIEAKKEGDLMQADLLVKTGNSEQFLTIPMKKEGGAWRVNSLDALHRLAILGIKRALQK